MSPPTAGFFLAVENGLAVMAEVLVENCFSLRLSAKKVFSVHRVEQQGTLFRVVDGLPCSARKAVDFWTGGWGAERAGTEENEVGVAPDGLVGGGLRLADTFPRNSKKGIRS
jgi:hypothetical protein